MSENTSKHCIHLAWAACRSALVRGFHSDCPRIEKTGFESGIVKMFYSYSHSFLESILDSVLSFPDPPISNGMYWSVLVCTSMCWYVPL